MKSIAMTILVTIMPNLVLATTCTQVNQMTLCDNGVTATQIGNVTQIHTPNGDSTIYSIGNQRIIQPQPQTYIPVPVIPSIPSLSPFNPLH